MNRIRSPFLLVILVHFCPTQMQADEVDESKEPPLKFVVKLDGKSIVLSEGTESQLKGAFTNPRISVEPEPYRVFPYQGVTFRYPRAFTFEADFSDPESKNWTLSGNDFKIIYFSMKDRITSENFAKNVVGQFGPGNARITNPTAKITLGDMTLAGTSLQVSVAGTKLVMDVYSVPSKKGVTRLLVFQDALDDNGNRSKEGTMTLKEIKASFSSKR